MRGFFQRFNNSVQRFMYGRYGIDELGSFMILVSLIIAALSFVPILSFLGFVPMVIIILSYIRCFSKNHTKRRNELDKYLKLKGRIRDWTSLRKRKHRDRKTHRYFKCKLCKKILRVPKGKGKIEIICPKCRSRIIKKT